MKNPPSPIEIEWAKCIKEFYDALEDDLNTAKAFSVMIKLCKKMKKCTEVDKERYMLFLGALVCFEWQLGFTPLPPSKEKEEEMHDAIRMVRKAADEVLEAIS